MSFATTVVGIITAIGTACTAVALVITALAALKRASKIEHKIDTVHVIVNQQHTDMVNYQRALVRALEVAGVAVPTDQSVEE